MENVYVKIDNNTGRITTRYTIAFGHFYCYENESLHSITVESTEGLIGKKLSDVSLLHRELRELREVVKFLERCAITRNVEIFGFKSHPSTLVYEEGAWSIHFPWVHNEGVDWDTKAHPSLHSALKSLLGEAKG